MFTGFYFVYAYSDIRSTTRPSVASTADGASTGVIIGIVVVVVALLILPPVMVFVVRKLLTRNIRNPVPSRQYPLFALDQQEGIHMTSNIACGCIPPLLFDQSGNAISMTTKFSSGQTGTHTSPNREIEGRVYSEAKDDCDDEYSYIPPTVLDPP